MIKPILGIFVALVAAGMGTLRADTASPAALHFTEFTVPFGVNSLGPIVRGRDGALWYGRVSHIGRMTTAGVITAEYGVPNGSGVSSITMGPDRALWFVDVNSLVGRITTAGAITDRALPDPASFPLSIAAGSDGALWFTEFNNAHIGRITTAGVITGYPILLPYHHPNAITAGPDGALWFTESDDTGDGIGRIATDGTFTHFPTALAGYGIVSGPDGNLWFTGANSIYRMTTGGTVTEFPLSTPNSFPQYIIRGPGGLWFNEHGVNAGDGNRLGRITVSGSITEFTIPTSNSFPNGITIGPDGAIWFTETGAGQIGRFGP